MRIVLTSCSLIGWFSIMKPDDGAESPPVGGIAGNKLQGRLPQGSRPFFGYKFIRNGLTNNIGVRNLTLSQGAIVAERNGFRGKLTCAWGLPLPIVDPTLKASGHPVILNFERQRATVFGGQMVSMLPPSISYQMLGRNSVTYGGRKMKAQSRSTAINVIGLISTIIGLFLLLYPDLRLNMALASALIIVGSFVQARYKRFDIYGSTYARWLEEQIQKILPAKMNPADDLGGRRILATILNLLGIPLVVLGFYLAVFPLFSLRAGIAVILLMLGIFLQVKFKAYIGDNAHEGSVMAGNSHRMSK